LSDGSESILIHSLMNVDSEKFADAGGKGQG
jgi:hypothetical protein